MLLNKLKPRDPLKKVFLRLKSNETEIESFKTSLIQLLDKANDTASEEFHKTLSATFLKKPITPRNTLSTLSEEMTL
ncbi:MAG: hypothetical protein OXH57_05345 [Ekhidna sp.]|nr:hypothetical protein [Ekhidna sp.]